MQPLATNMGCGWPVRYVTCSYAERQETQCEVSNMRDQTRPVQILWLVWHTYPDTSLEGAVMLCHDRRASFKWQQTVHVIQQCSVTVPSISQALTGWIPLDCPVQDSHWDADWGVHPSKALGEEFWTSGRSTSYSDSVSHTGVRIAGAPASRAPPVPH